MNLRAILIELLNDRVIQAGTGSSPVSIGSAVVLKGRTDTCFATLEALQPWVVFFAGLFGGILSLVLIFYTVLRIRRLMKNPNARE